MQLPSDLARSVSANLAFSGALTTDVVAPALVSTERYRLWAAQLVITSGPISVATVGWVGGFAAGGAYVDTSIVCPIAPNEFGSELLWIPGGEPLVAGRAISVLHRTATGTAGGRCYVFYTIEAV